MPGTWYSVVINNPTPADEVDINSARSMGWTIEGQLEVGKNGTPHYQLAVCTQEPWKVVKGQFPRANIQEAQDPEALRKYVVKEATRVLDLTTPPAPRRNRNSGRAAAQFFESVFEEAYTQFGLGVDEMIKNDDSLKVFDLAVNQLVVENGYDTAIRATRPDVRSAYKRYRYAMWSIWYHKNIPQEDIQHADEDEGSEQAAGVLGRKHEDDEGVSEGSSDSDGEDDSDSQQESEASDSEGD